MPPAPSPRGSPARCTAIDGPPAEPFEVAVEWPAFDVPLTFTEIDGAAIAAAAEHARPYWP